MRLSDAFPSKYLREPDLKGRAVTVTIDRVEMEEVGQKKERRLVCYFSSGIDKPLVINKTNGTKIASIAGTDDTDDWHGVRVTLYPSVTTMQGEEVACIRVKPAMAPKAAPKPEPLPLDSSDDDEREPGWDD